MVREKIPTLYHEKQYRNYCRCHALHNLIGKKILSSFSEFDTLCDSFDRENKYDVGVSRRNYFFINNGNTDNIFGYILGKKGYHVRMNHYDYYKRKKIVPDPKSLGFIVYTHSHTYCVRNINGVLYQIDSMRRAIMPINTKLLERPGLGVIDVIRL